MAKKLGPKNSTASTVAGTALAFGGSVKSVALPSGSKLLFDDPDQDGIIQFLGTKDITDKVPDANKPVIYMIGCDGKRNVSMPLTYQINETLQKGGFTPGKYYYFHLADLVTVNPNFNDMKDFNIVELGSEGETVPVTSDRLPGIKEITLTHESIKELNYAKLNYPLRKV